MAEIHFWTLHAEARQPWDPDLRPDLHQSAYGHAFLELHWRLRSLHAPVSIGAPVPRDARVVVASLEELTEWQPRIRHRAMVQLALAALRPTRSPALAVLRVDLPLEVQSPGFTTLEFMPTRASIESPGQVFVPMLPQRGLIPRDERRGSTLETVVLKSLAANVPAWLDCTFMRHAALFGFTIRVDTEDQGRWHDFHDVDIALCTHDATSLGDDRRKPATKLVNAWRAGAIPICGPHTGYLELGRPGDTMLVAETRADYLRALARLRADASLVSHLRANLSEEARTYEPDDIVRAYWEALTDAPRAARTEIASALLGGAASGARARLTRYRESDERSAMC